MMDRYTFLGLKCSTPIHCHYKAWKSQDILLLYSSHIELLTAAPVMHDFTNCRRALLLRKEDCPAKLHNALSTIHK